MHLKNGRKVELLMFGLIKKEISALGMKAESGTTTGEKQMEQWNGGNELLNSEPVGNLEAAGELKVEFLIMDGRIRKAVCRI